MRVGIVRETVYELRPCLLPASTSRADAANDLSTRANIRSMQSAASAHAQFRRALDRGNLLSALSAARDMPHVGLAEALELTVLIREKEPERFGRAAARWAARWASELPSVDLSEAQLVQAALASLASEDGQAGAWTLLALSREEGCET